MKNWLLQLGRLRNPTIYCLQTEHPGKASGAGQFSLSQKAWEPGDVMVIKLSKYKIFYLNILFLKEDKMRCASSITEAGKQRLIPLPSALCSIPALSGLEDTDHPGVDNLLYRGPQWKFWFLPERIFNLGIYEPIKLAYKM